MIKYVFYLTKKKGFNKTVLVQKQLNCWFSLKKIIKPKIRLKLRLFNKMFKLKKYYHILKPTIHLSNLFWCQINQRLYFKKKKKFLKIYTRSSKYLMTSLQILVNKRKINEYTKRGLFLNNLIFLKKNR